MNEKGFSLVEMLVSISIVFMLSILILPSFMSILIERKNLVLRNEGHIILQEQLYTHYHLFSEIKETDERDGTTYSIQNTGKNICVTWENRKQQKEKICREIIK